MFTDSALVIIFTTVSLNGVVAGPLVRSLSLTDRGPDLASHSSSWASYTWWEERYLRPVLHQEIQVSRTDWTGLAVAKDNLAVDMQEKQQDSTVDLNIHFNSVVNL